MIIEIVSFPLKMVIFHGDVNVYQRVDLLETQTLSEFCAWTETWRRQVTGLDDFRAWRQTYYGKEPPRVNKTPEIID